MIMKNPCAVVRHRSAINTVSVIVHFISSVTLPLSFTIFLTIKRCRRAKTRRYSGMSTAHTKRGILSLMKHVVLRTNFWKVLLFLSSTGSGRWGWMAPQVHTKIVVRQLHMMFHRVLQVSMSLHDDDEVPSLTSGTDCALTASEWMRRKVIMTAQNVRNPKQLFMTVSTRNSVYCTEHSRYSQPELSLTWGDK